jgi:hypothetical protein
MIISRLGLFVVWISLILTPVCPVGAETGGPVHLSEFTNPGEWGPDTSLASSTDSERIPFKSGDKIRVKGTIDNGGRMNVIIIMFMDEIPKLQRDGASVDFTYTIPTITSGTLTLLTENIGSRNGTIDLTITRESTEAQTLAVCFGLVGLVIVGIVVAIVLILRYRKKHAPIQQQSYPQNYYPYQQYPPQYIQFQNQSAPAPDYCPNCQSPPTDNTDPRCTQTRYLGRCKWQR